MNEDKEKKEYELAVLVKTEEELPKLLTLIGQHKGEMIAEPRAKRLALAYEIKGVNEAVFAYCGFRGFPEDAKNLEGDLNNRAEVLRSMIIASPPPAEKLSSPYMPRERRGRPSSSRSASTGSADKPPAPAHLSNEALEKKIEEILQ
jgi:ribosomal protein S6